MLYFFKSIINYFWKRKSKSIFFNPYNDKEDDFLIKDELRNNEPFFRKFYPPLDSVDKEHIEISENEINIIQILMNNSPHPNIVKYYEVNSHYADMELLDIKINLKRDKRDIIETMNNVKSFLQNLGIMYIDWKFDNIGYSKKDKVYKLFDFDLSGVIDLETNEWIIEPRKSWAYNNAIKNKKRTPQQIDHYSFNQCFNYWSII